MQRRRGRRGGGRGAARGSAAVRSPTGAPLLARPLPRAPLAPSAVHGAVIEHHVVGAPVVPGEQQSLGGVSCELLFLYDKSNSAASQFDMYRSGNHSSPP